MSDIEAQRIVQRIDTVLDILVAGDYHSAINNLEILKAELLDQVKDGISPPVLRGRPGKSDSDYLLRDGR
ncbi:conserved domain protein [Salmonella enterica subsp. houtenae]|nr:conserved domain protein [Salmonella enterica subsp. houtenae]